MAQSLLPNGRRRIAERTEFVLLILKEVGIDGAGAYAVLFLQSLHLRHLRDAFGQIPQDVQSHSGRDSGEAVDLSSVGKLLLNGGSGGSLSKYAKASAGVGESPGGNLDLERIQSLHCPVENRRFRCCHDGLPHLNRAGFRWSHIRIRFFIVLRRQTLIAHRSTCLGVGGVVRAGDKRRSAHHFPLWPQSQSMKRNNIR